MPKFNPATLKYIRKSRRITQEQLAAKCGVGRDMVSHWERGKHEPCQRNLKKLENVLELPKGELCKSTTEFFNKLFEGNIQLILHTRMEIYQWADEQKDLKHQAFANQTANLLLRELKALQGNLPQPAAPSEAQIAHENLLEEGEEPEWKK